MSMQHYEGVIGTFDYDDNVWEIRELNEEHYQDLYNFDYDTSHILHLKRGYQGPISLPKGVVSCEGLFCESNLTNCWFEDFDTSEVTNMRFMFGLTIIPRGFILGDKFNTSKVETMRSMFQFTEMPEGFSLGNNFDTSNVEDMSQMFYEVNLDWERQERGGYLPKGFVLGSKFTTSKTNSFLDMFDSVDLKEVNLLKDATFDFSNNDNYGHVFEGCFFPKGFSFGDNFNMCQMGKYYDGLVFYACNFEGDIDFGDKVDVSNDLFTSCRLNGEWIPDEYTTAEIIDLLSPKGKSIIDKILKEIEGLVQQGKTEEAKKKVQEGYINYKGSKDFIKRVGAIIPKETLVEGVYLADPNNPLIKAYVSKEVIPELTKHFNNSQGISKITAGEACSLLYKKYSKVLVNEAMVQYIWDQYLE